MTLVKPYKSVALIDEHKTYSIKDIVQRAGVKQCLRFVVTDGEQDFKMYVESIQRDFLVTKCENHYKLKCMGKGFKITLDCQF